MGSSIYKYIKERVIMDLKVGVYLALLFNHVNKPYTLPSVAILLQGSIVTNHSHGNAYPDIDDIHTSCDLLIQTKLLIKILEEFDVPKYADILEGRKTATSLIASKAPLDKKYPNYTKFLEQCKKYCLDPYKVIQAALTLSVLMKITKVEEFNYVHVTEPNYKNAYEMDIKKSYVAALYFTNMFKVNKVENGFVQFEPYHPFNEIHEGQRTTLTPMYTLSVESSFKSKPNALSVDDVVVALVDGKTLHNVLHIDENLYHAVNRSFKDLLK